MPVWGPKIAAVPLSAPQLTTISETGLAAE
jgi:hypothetical protein